VNFSGIDTTLLMQAGAALGALVVVFYILKLKRRPTPVPFGPLWQRILRDKEATSWFQQIKRLFSLLLQLALLTALLLSLSDPTPVIAADEGRHVVVLMDTSASMKAVDVPQPEWGEDVPEAERIAKTRLDVGKEKMREVVRSLGGADRMLIAQMDAAVTPLSTMTSEPAELEAALVKVHATDVRAQYAKALRFAVDALRGLSKPEIIVVSDGALGEPLDGAGGVELGDVKLSLVPIGEGGRNVAVSTFSVRRYPLDKSRYEVLLEVTNTSEEPADVDLELYGDDQLTDIKSITIHPKESLSRFYPNLAGANERIEARVKLKGDSPDQLPADDRAFALLPERRRARVQVVTEGNMYLEAALFLDEYLEVTTIAPSAYPAAGKFDVTIFDNVSPAVEAGSGDVLYLNPTDDTNTPFKLGEKLKTTKDYSLGFDETDTKHPIMRHLSLGDVNIGAGVALEGEKGDTALGKSFKGTILLEGRRKGMRFVAMGFDLRESDLPLRIAWPLFLLNTINFFNDEDSSYISSYRTGEVWNIPASSTVKTASLELPSGEKQLVPIKDGRAVFLGQQAGFYDLALGEGEGAEHAKFAANLSDPLESAIEPKKELAVGEIKSGDVEGFTVTVRRVIWVYLLAGVLLAMVLEWFTYHRRWTV
jgi:hypothetical protein